MTLLFHCRERKQGANRASLVPLGAVPTGSCAASSHHTATCRRRNLFPSGRPLLGPATGIRFTMVMHRGARVSTLVCHSDGSEAGSLQPTRPSMRPPGHPLLGRCTTVLAKRDRSEPGTQAVASRSQKLVPARTMQTATQTANYAKCYVYQDPSGLPHLSPTPQPEAAKSIGRLSGLVRFAVAKETRDGFPYGFPTKLSL